MSQSAIATILPGGVWGGRSPPKVSTPFLPGKTEGYRKVASNQQKLGQQTAYGRAVIATRGFRARQKSYGFRAV